MASRLELRPETPQIRTQETNTAQIVPAQAITCNIRDFVPLDQRYKASGRIHGGLVLVSSKAFPQDRSFIGALVSALDHLLGEDAMRGDAVMFLGHRPEGNEMPGAD
jgi:hypothetical protein